MTLIVDLVTAAKTVSALSNRVFDEDPPERVAFPYVTVTTDISLVGALHGDGQAKWLHRTAQVDLWERMSAEDEAIRLALFAALDGRVVTGGVRLAVSSMVRLGDPDPGVVHTSLTIERRQPR